MSTLLSSSDETGASMHGGKSCQTGNSLYVPWMLPEKMLAALDDSLLHEVPPSSEAASLPPAGTCSCYQRLSTAIKWQSQITFVRMIATSLVLWWQMTDLRCIASCPDWRDRLQILCTAQQRRPCKALFSRAYHQAWCFPRLPGLCAMECGR